MIYLVDGHNLIPKIPGLSLKALDDEMQLIALLQTFARVKRKKIEVYFDRAAVAQAGTKKFGAVTAHFVHQTSSADDAIRQRLAKSAHANHDTCVVSSDHGVQNSARAYHASVQTSESFASELLASAFQSAQPSNSRESKVSNEEVEEWLKVFNQKNLHKKE